MNNMLHALQQRYGQLASVVLLSSLVGCAPPSWHKDATDSASPVQTSWVEARRSIFGLTAYDARTILAVGAAGAYFRSVDAGHTWLELRLPTDSGVRCLALGSPGTMLAVGDRGVILVTHDGGKKWRVDSTSVKETLYAVAATARGRLAFAVGNAGTLLRSDDGGDHWAMLKTGERHNLFAVACSADGRNVFVGGSSGTFLESHDGGARWSSRTVSKHALFSIYLSLHSNRLVATGPSGSILDSEDGGKSWSTVRSNVDDDLQAIAVSPSEKLMCVVGIRSVLVSTNLGRSWRSTGLPASPPDMYAVSVPSDRAILAAGSGCGVIGSDDCGEKWGRRTQLGGELYSVATSDRGDLVLAAGEGSTLLRSTNRGQYWESLKGPSFASFYGVAVDPSGASAWVLGRDAGVAISRDRGTSWTTLIPDTGGDAAFLSLNPSSERLWAWGLSGYVARSDNGGNSWVPKRLPTSRKVLALGVSRDDDRLWAVGDSGLVAFSKDGGNKWHLLDTDLGETLTGVYVPPDGNAAWVAGVGGTVASFHPDGSCIAQARLLPVDLGEQLSAITGSEDGAQLWAGGSSGSLYHSNDSGRTWQIEFRNSKLYLNALRLSEDSTVYAVGDSAAIVVGRVLPAPLPRLLRSRYIPTGLSVTLELSLDDSITSWDDLQLGLLVTGEADRTRGLMRSVPVAISRPAKHGDAWRLSLDPASLGFRPGDVIYSRVTFTRSRSQTSLQLKPIRYLPWYWLRQHLAVVSILAVMALVLAGLGALFVLRPAALVRVHESKFVGAISEGFGNRQLAWLCSTLIEGTLLPMLVRHARTQDAWIDERIERIREALNLEQPIAANPLFVPLPVTVHSGLESKTSIDRPEPREIGRLLDGHSTAVEIVGTGGAGKTALLCEIARWLVAPKTKGIFPWPALPIFIDQKTDSAVAALQEQLRGWLGYNVSQVFASALLSSKRAILMADGLSEREAGLIESVRVMASSGTCTVIATARLPGILGTGSAAYIEPDPLDGSTLGFFLTGVLRGHPALPPFDSIEGQFRLAQSLVGLITRSNSKVTLTPLLVRLYVERALALVAAGGTLEHLPRSIPDAYFDYLRQINPTGTTSPDRLTTDLMFQAAEALAMLSMGDDLIPKAFPRGAAREALIRAGLAETHSVAVQRLATNGVLLSRPVGPEEILRFALDPVCEFLAAFARAKLCGSDQARWDLLDSEVLAAGDSAVGFASALRLVREAYGHDMNWPHLDVK